MRTLALFTLLAGACSGEDFTVTPLYNHANGRVVVELTRSLEAGETLHVRARRGSFGQLDCKQLATEVAPVEDATGERIDGPLVDPALTKPIYDSPEWLDPTPEMLAQLANGVDSIIDVCVMDGDKVVAKVERDLFQAWDTARAKGFGGKADDPSGEQRINSPLAYGERCVGELGEIPFFEKTGDGTYTTYDCLESTPIPMTVTDANGNVRAPQEGTEPACDAPQFIYSLCEAGPRVATRVNDQGTRWVLLCRKSIGGYASNQYNDIAMIGSNPFTGKTCFFQNALYAKTDGGHVPHPADREKSQNLWQGVHGGVGSGIECGKCHSVDAFIHSPWIDGAKDNNGRPVVPKMGIDPDFPLGANDTPYAIVNRRGQSWTMPKQLVSSEANECLKCHRMADDRWSDDWLARLDNQDATWNGILSAKGGKPESKYWMPPDHSFATDAEWQASAAKQALDYVERCGRTPTLAGCIYKDIPETVDGSGTGGKLRNPVNLPDDELAKQATTLIGFNKNTPSQVCAECHAPNELTLRDWQEKTTTAVATCLAETGGGGGEAHDENRTNIEVGRDDVKTFGPFDVAEGSFFEVTMTGTGDADLYVKRGAEASTSVYDCRPYTDGSNESCTRSAYNAAGPAKFWIAVNGYASTSKVSLNIKYASPGGSAMSAKDRVACFRMEPEHSDSSFTPAKLGIYAAAAHLGWFQDTFKQAYPADQDGNTADTWALAYGKFKGRVSMPKGNHPRFTQGELDIVAEWFARGLPRLTTYIAPDTGPTSCTPSISSQVATHVNQMATAGWSAVNRAAGINMYGCGGATDPRSCLTSLPTAQSKSYGTGWAKVGTLRILRELSFSTYYWMRSSADGRFVANGSTGSNSVISDLQTSKDIKVEASYDPGFFPDNHGWVFQDTPIGAGFCPLSLLQSNPDRINFSEPVCSSVDTVSLYQHLGAGLGGADYFVINSQFTSDFPSEQTTEDPSAAFSQGAQMKLTPMIFDGQHYVGKPAVSTSSPFEGDSVLSPSTKLVISRFGNQQQQLGYVLRKLTTTPSGSSYTVSTTEVARYCTQGSKPSISFDEKYFVAHHYVTSNDWQDLGFASPSDPTFQAMLAKGTSNIILVNLTTGARTRVTTMKPGQYALYPHFRSDGWFYFLVRDQNTGKEYAVASDAALP